MALTAQILSDNQVRGKDKSFIHALCTAARSNYSFMNLLTKLHCTARIQPYTAIINKVNKYKVYTYQYKISFNKDIRNSV